MSLTHWDIALWITGYMGYIVLAAVMLLRRRYKACPWFSVLLASQIVQSIILVTICSPRYRVRYFYAYWAGEVVNAAIMAAVILEISRIFVRTINLEESKILRDIRVIVWMFPPVLVFAVTFLRFLPNLHHELANLAFKFDTICALWMITLVGAVSISIYFYGMRFRVHVVAIAYGLTVYHASRLLVYIAVLTTADGHLWRNLEFWVKPLHVVTLFVWSVVLWLNEPDKKMSGGLGRLFVTGDRREMLPTDMIRSNPNKTADHVYNSSGQRAYSTAVRAMLDSRDKEHRSKNSSGLLVRRRESASMPALRPGKAAES